MRPAVFFCPVWLTAWLLSPAGAATIYISPQGLDANNGLTRAQQAPGDGPVATLEQAMRLVRKARSARTEPEADHIVLLPGRYDLADTFTLRSEDSGTANAPLVIRAEQPGSAWITGAVQLAGFAAMDGSATVSKQLDLNRGFHVLWVNGQRATRARSPNGGGFYSGAANVVPAIAGDRLQRPRNPYNIINTQKVILPAEARKRLSESRSPEDQAVLIALHSWTSSAHRIMHWDAERGAATVQPESLWSFLRFGPDQRFALENLPEFLDEPGEWWLSPKGELRYWPRAGESTAQLRADAPQLERLFALRGTERAPVQHVRLEGLRFAYSAAWTAPFIDSQAATAAPAALVAEYAQHIEIAGCRFENLGGHGVWLRKGSQQNVLRHNVFSQLGAGAVRVGEVAMPSVEADRVQANQLLDNLIEDTGQSFPGAVGIWVGQSGGNLIAHNELRRTSYTGISLGWTWGFGGSLARDNIVEHNVLRHIGQGLLSDLGAIYMLGISPGTVIRHNLIEDVRSFRQQGSTAWGIYLDEGSSHILVENNWVSGTTGGGLHLHYGNNNVVRNNIFKGGQVAQARRSRRNDSALTVERNVLWADAQPAWEREWLDDEVITRDNIVITSGSAPRTTAGMSLQQLQSAGKETGSTWVKAPEVNCNPDRCALAAPVLKATGFQPFSLKPAGIRDPGKLLR